MSLTAYKAVWQLTELKGARKTFMLALAEFSDDNGACWPSYETLAEMTGSSERHLKRVAASLKDDGYLEYAQNVGRGNSNKYQITALKGDTVSPITEDANLKKGDISSLKGDISSLKGDIVSPEPLEPSGTVIKKESAQIPAAVLMYREVVHRYPPKAIWHTLDDCIGGEIDNLNLWKSVIIGWIGNGWKPTNLNGMMDWFKRGEVPGKDKPNGHHKQSSARTNRNPNQRQSGKVSRDGISTEPTPGLREEIERRKKQVARAKLAGAGV